LNMRSPEIEASSVMTRDGLMVASVLKPGVEPDRVAAMCAALLGLGETAARELDRGALKLVLLHGEKGVLLLVQIGDRHVLALSATTDIKLGAVLMESKRTASLIQAELS
jgi:uncharacterized protein